MLNTRRLKEEMDRNNLNQTQLADKVGVTIVSMNRYVNGGRTPRELILNKIALTLGVTPEYLLGQNDTDHPDITFAKVRVAVKESSHRWTATQIRELINLLITALLERR